MRHTWAQIIPYFRPRLPTTSTLPPSESPERNQEGSGNTHPSGNPPADASSLSTITRASLPPPPSAASTPLRRKYRLVLRNQIVEACGWGQWWRCPELWVFQAFARQTEQSKPRTKAIDIRYFRTSALLSPSRARTVRWLILLPCFLRPCRREESGMTL